MAQQAFLAKLTLGQLAKPTKTATPEMDRRIKLILKLNEQLALANAQTKGEKFGATKKGWGTDAEGKRVRVDLPRRLAPWFFPQDGKVILLCRYGASPLTLGSKGQKSIMLPNLAAVPGAIQIVIDAVGAGELDAAIADVVGARTRTK